MEYNEDDYILIDKELAKSIAVGVIIYTGDGSNNINSILDNNIKCKFFKYNNGFTYPLRVIFYEEDNDNYDTVTGFSFGCVLKSDLSLPSLLSLVEDDDLLIL